MDKLIETLGITSLSKSEVSVTAKELDTAVEAFRSCPLDASPGSGKSMAYIVPIIDRVMWEGSGHGVRPVVVYPMNAPANSQCNNLEKFLGKANRKVTFERWFTFQNKWKVHDATTHSDDSIGIQCRHVGHRVTATRWRSFRTGGGVSRSVLLAACR